MRIPLLAALLFGAVLGCKPTPPPAQRFAYPWDGLSLSEMRAEHDRMRAQWWHDCIAPPPDVVRDNQPLCNHEIQEMTPLGNAIAVREMQMQAKR